ncbi:MAG: Na+:solute symporter [bacterium]|nr:MAG: Na+:solute symporter [bacterium]
MSFPLGTLDILVLCLYIVFIFGVGLAFSRRASRNTEEFFVSGRSLPWWIVGTSMVATTFAADTPLVVSGLVARGGIFKNWLWWYYGIGGIVAVFLFARLWNRAGITTDAELIEIRYDGRPASVLRCYRAVWFGLAQNVLVIAWVMRAMAKIVLVVMGWDQSVQVLGMNAEVFTVLILFVIAVSYTALSGLWGVVMTDLLQFILAMVGSVYLAISAVSRLGGIDGVLAGLRERGFPVAETLRMIPAAGPITEANPFTEFLIMVLIVWWASYNIDGCGYLSQRLFAAKDERHSALGYLWYSFAHICLRPWPWIVVGLCGMVLFGTISDPETYYPMVMRTILPPGIFGLVIASFFAAFMSTIDTQLNWGASLLVNDIARRFLWRGKTERFYLACARISVIGIAVLGAIASFAVSDISAVWKLVLAVTAGLGSVIIARWYWWRVNAWSEIAAMATALTCTLVFWALGSDPRFAGRAFLRFPYSAAITVLISIPVWLTVTLMTRPVDSRHLERFFERVRPGGPGWRTIARGISIPQGNGSPRRSFMRIGAGIVALYAGLFGTGKLVLGDYTPGLLYIILALASATFLFVSLRRPSS